MELLDPTRRKHKHKHKITNTNESLLCTTIIPHLQAFHNVTKGGSKLLDLAQQLPAAIIIDLVGGNSTIRSHDMISIVVLVTFKTHLPTTIKITHHKQIMEVVVMLKEHLRNNET